MPAYFAVLFCHRYSPAVEASVRRQVITDEPNMISEGNRMGDWEAMTRSYQLIYTG